MDKKTKTNQESPLPVGYESPSVRVIDLKTNHTILAGSEYSTPPTEMGGQNAF